jgi:hypothetical protein
MVKEAGLDSNCLFFALSGNCLWKENCSLGVHKKPKIYTKLGMKKNNNSFTPSEKILEKPANKPSI